MEVTSVELVVRIGPVEVTIAQDETANAHPNGSANVAGFDFGRLARIAGCVVACMAGTPVAGQHGQEQPGDGQGEGGQLVDVKGEEGQRPTRPARPGR